MERIRFYGRLIVICNEIASISFYLRYIPMQWGGFIYHVLTSVVSNGHTMCREFTPTDRRQILISEGPHPLQCHHNGHGGVSNHQPLDCLLNCLFKLRLKKTSKLCVTGLCAGNSPVTVKSPHKGPVTRKMFSLDDAIMQQQRGLWSWVPGVSCHYCQV